MNLMVAKGYLQHIASDGDRWDNLSYQYYGDATAYEQIIIANRHLSITPTLSAGQIVFIPIITAADKQRNNAVPPWLRSDEEDSDD